VSVNIGRNLDMDFMQALQEVAEKIKPGEIIFPKLTLTGGSL